MWGLISLANRHPRVDILKPGPGVGGHCIAVDPWFIVASAPDEARLVHAAREINDAKPDWVIGKVRAAIGEFPVSNPDKTARDVTLACLGLTFKPNIDDLRQSPALQIAIRLADSHEGRLMLVEPNIENLPDSLTGHEKVGIEEAIAQADLLVLLVAHEAFRDIDARLKPRHILFAATKN